MGSSKLTLVLMAGLPGSGKTTLARALCEELCKELKWFLVDKDKHKEELLRPKSNEEVAINRAYEKSNEEVVINRAYEKSFEEARTMLTEYNTSVIFDSAALDEETLENARKIVRNYPYVQLRVILCIVADSKVREVRLRNRQPRHLTNRVDPTDKNEYLKYFRHLPSDRLELDTEQSLEKCLEEARNYIMDQESDSAAGPVEYSFIRS